MNDSFNMSNWRHKYVVIAENDEELTQKGTVSEASDEETDLDHYMNKIITAAEKAKNTWSKDDRNRYFIEIVQAVKDAKSYIKSLGE
jgi:hypothetical protein